MGSGKGWATAGLVAGLILGLANAVGAQDEARGARRAREAREARGALGALSGRVRLAGGVDRQLRRVENHTDPEICGALKEVRDLRVSDTGGVGDVLVWLEGDGLSEVATEVPATKVLDNVDCEFAPQTLAMEVGGALDLANSDSTLHTVHWRGPSEENVALPLREIRVERHLPQPGLYSIRCDVHPWMRAWIRVDDHPFHVATDLDGGFRIEGVPPGSYRLVAWHERLGTTAVQVTVERAAMTSVSMTLGESSAPAD